VSAAIETRDELLPSLDVLAGELRKKARSFDKIVKCGRTHLQDAVPIRMGQVFGAYASMLEHDRARLERCLEGLKELPIGGTAVGTGLNTPPGYREKILRYMSEESGMDFRSAHDMVEAMQSFDAVVDFSGALRVLATSLKKIADDFRLMGSGPRTGLGELELPAVQPGSSIMPGKVNPVMAEMLDMVAFQVFGCDTTIAQAAQAGQLELNVMMPVIGYNLLHAIAILSSSMRAFAMRCVRGVKVDREKCRLHAERSATLATALSPAIGYHKAAELAREALVKNMLLRDLAAAKNIMSKRELDELLDLYKMTEGLSGAPSTAKAMSRRGGARAGGKAMRKAKKRRS